MFDWDFPKLESLIEDRGDIVIHETGIACTCRNDDAFGHFVNKNGQPVSSRRINCKLCQGDGLIFRNARVVKGLITSVNAGSGRRLMEDGYAVPGDCIFSPSMQIGIIGDFDRITMTTSTPISEGQVIVRNVARLGDNQTYEFNVDSDQDKLWYLPDSCIHCEDEDGTLYTQGTDFVFEDKTIRWVGNKPRDGKLYTIKYTAFLEWIAYASPFNRFDRNRSLAQRVLLKKKHTTNLTGSTADTPEKRKEEEVVFTTKTVI